MAEIRALIVGGGIGGAALAIGLRQRGINATVFERADELRKVAAGGGIQVRNNGARALQEIGMAEKAEAAGNVMETYVFRKRDGQVLGEWPVGQFGREVGAPTIAIRRGALHEVLSRELGPEAYQLGAQFAGYSEDRDGVTVRFADGREERGDVLIGCDGLNSAVRAQLVGDSKPRYVGFTVWRTILEFEHPKVGAHTFDVWMGAGTRFSFYYVAPKQLYWFGTFGCPPGGQDPPGGHKAAALKVFGDWPDPIPAMIEAADEARVLRMDTMDRAPVPRWGAGTRVTLLGDAAHPLSFTQGQGSNQALEDAVVLARCLAEEKDVIGAVSRYERERIPRTTEMINSSYQFGRGSIIANPAAVALRNVIMRLLLPKMFEKQKKEVLYEF
jgi:2-polyprenyl-6-methoxyphenol hydroxylase-like FAD-dependent oxidoreductase